jgi:activator of HSP90 ATPase
MDEDEYEFTSSIETGEGAQADAFNKTAKKQLANKLRPIFQAFPKAMIDTHGKDLLADAAAAGDESQSNSGASTPAAKPAQSVPSVSGLSIGSQPKSSVSLGPVETCCISALTYGVLHSPPHLSTPRS